MIDKGKHNLLGVLVDAIDYDAAVERVIDAAHARRRFGVTALAVHGVMEAVADPTLCYRINHLDLVTADGQPVRWSLNILHDAALADRCYGPTLMTRVCQRAAHEGLPVYLYGSTQPVLSRLAANITDTVPDIDIAGTSPSVFGRVNPAELDAIAERIRSSGARLVFAGLGCPRQEIFAYEMRDRLGMPVVAVGAAFDYHAGIQKEPPKIVQRAGLQWLWRLISEPGRLWRRYATTNPAFIAGIARQRRGTLTRDPDACAAPTGELGYA